MKFLQKTLSPIIAPFLIAGAATFATPAFADDAEKPAEKPITWELSADFTNGYNVRGLMLNTGNVQQLNATACWEWLCGIGFFNYDNGTGDDGKKIGYNEFDAIVEASHALDNGLFGVLGANYLMFPGTGDDPTHSFYAIVGFEKGRYAIEINAEQIAGTGLATELKGTIAAGPLEFMVALGDMDDYFGETGQYVKIGADWTLTSSDWGSMSLYGRVLSGDLESSENGLFHDGDKAWGGVNFTFGSPNRD